MLKPKILAKFTLFLILAVLAPKLTSEIEASIFFVNHFELQKFFFKDYYLLPITPWAGSVKQKIEVLVTAYSSTIEETDENPFLTADESSVKEGIVASNLLEIGTKIRIPEIFGEKIFIVKDRMNKKKGKYQIDVWFEDQKKALEFGVKKTYIEILE
jgi:3D (Asp-Asp-Asp) domain-containing protein